VELKTLLKDFDKSNHNNSSMILH